MNNRPKITVSAGTSPSEAGTNGNFIITLDTPAPAGGLVVNYNLTGSTATNPADYSFDVAQSTNITAITPTSFVIAAGATSASLAIVPVNDGIVDPGETVQLNVTPGNDYILGSNSTAPFTEASTITLGRFGTLLAVEDFNGDGKKDLIFVSEGNLGSRTISLLLGNGDGSFTTSNLVPRPFVRGFAISARVADFNNDGKPDLAIIYDGPSNNNGIGISLNDGNGNFTTNRIDSSVGRSTHSFASLADFNNDGKLDILTRSSSDLILYLNDGNGSFTPSSNFTSRYTYALSTTFLSAVDFNRDGKLDLVYVRPDSNNVSILLGNGDSSFTTAPTEVSVGTSPILSIAIRDLNKDGKLDFAVTNSDSDKVSILLNDGSGGFTTSTVTVKDSSELLVRDFNLDGFDDIAAFDYTSGKISILLNDGNGGFANSSTIAFGSATSINLGDFDGDGFDDFLVVNGNSNNLSILLNDGSGSFATPTFSTFALGSDFRLISIQDFDGNGRDDLIVKNVKDDISSSFSILLNANPSATLTITDASALALPSGAITYTENAAPTILDTAATINYTDSPNLNNSILTARLINVTPSDRLAIRNQGNETGQIGLDGRIITYSGTPIGTFTGGIGSENLVVSFNNAIPPMAVEALLRNITFSNVSEAPTGNRTVEVVFSDGNSSSNAATKDITLSGVNDKPVIGNTVVLYNGATDTLPTTTTLPNSKGWIYNSTPGAVIAKTGGVTNINTTVNAGVQAGFANISQTLDNTKGYTVSFTAQVVAESRTSTANKNNDGKDDRAGFSVLVVSSDNTKAIELGFWENRIWAQEDGTSQINPALEPDDSPESNFRTLFTQAESVTFDTKNQLVNYDLAVQGDNYTLFADGNAILSGTMRNYTAFNKLPAAINPYTRSNNIFFGDNTPSAQANVNLAKVALTTNDTALFTRTAIEGVPLAISNLAITDLDAGTSNLTLNLSVEKGSLTVDNVTGGVVNVTNNGTGNVTLTGTVNQINTTLAANGLTYQINPSVFGTDLFNISVSDGIDSNSKSEAINIVRVFSGAGRNNPITGTPGDDLITGGPGAKTITGGDGSDRFIFNSLRDVGQRIADFELGSDKLDFTKLLDTIVPSGYDRDNILTDGYVKFIQGSTTNSTILQIDRDGSQGLLIPRNFLVLDNVTPTQMNDIDNFVF
jgi:hypothetical protein